MSSRHLSVQPPRPPGASGTAPDGTREGWRFLLGSIGPNWAPLSASFAVALSWTAIVVTVPLLLGAAVNAGIVGHDETRLVVLSGVIALLGLAQGGASTLRRATNGLASRRLEAELRQRFFAKLLELEVAYHDAVNRGQLLSRLTSDLFQIQAFVSSGPYWTASVVTLLAVAAVLIWTSPLLGVLSVAGLPFVAVGSRYFSAAVRERLAELQAERGELAGVVEETVTGIRAVKGFGAEGELAARLGSRADDVRESAMQVVALRTRFIPVAASVPLLELAVLDWFGAHLVLQHHLSIGTLLAFNAYIGLIAAPVQSIGGYVVLGQRALVSARRLHNVMRRLPAIADPPRPEPLPPGPGAVELRGVRFAYPGSTSPALEDIDLVIGGGEVVALVGPTGSGKSTLLALISRLYDPGEGTVRLDGADLRGVALSSLRNETAVVFEDNFLFDDTIAANVALDRRDVGESKLDAALSLARADAFVAALPEGVQTVVGERGFSLSGGQRQRLALARALAGEPRVLMLDDATSAIDAANERAIVAGLRRARLGRTTIIVSHRPATIAAASSVVLLDGGRVLATGTHHELLGSCPRYLEVLGGSEYRHPSAGAGQGRAGGERGDGERGDGEPAAAEVAS